jgi:hypothetical protein
MWKPRRRKLAVETFGFVILLMVEICVIGNVQYGYSSPGEQNELGELRRTLH